jgi:uncharacterized protein YqhQ
MNPIHVGGQAVIEGVMMRAPKALAIVVRRRNGQLVSREEEWRSLSDRWTFLKWPVVRGPIILIETLINGIQALNFSAGQVLEEEGETEQNVNRWALNAALFLALALGLGLFVALPHILAAWVLSLTTFKHGVDSLWFHAADGFIKILFFWAYIRLISLHGDIKRIFQYHGAEHKAIHAYEQGEALTIENARKYSTIHPRCGTSFILLVLLISVIFFATVFALMPRLPEMNPLERNALLILYKIAFMIPIAGFAYELIRWSGRGKKTSLPLRLLMAPGLWLQKLTTREPSDSQMEVALKALGRVIEIESRNQLQDVVL